MKQGSAARARFRELIRQPEPALDLAEAALCIAWEDQGAAEPEDALRELDALAASARARIAGHDDPWRQIEALNHYLFEELGFGGNTWHYSDPANSFVDRVLATRAGLPITLSVIYIELGRRLGLPISGVALPGYFLVRYSAPGGDIYIDPFRQGKLWSREECEQQIAAAYGDDVAAVIDRIMEPPSKRAIIVRMLRNLKNAYVEAGNPTRALAVVERILLVEPDDPDEVRDRGLLRARMGFVHLALEDFDRYAKLSPKARDMPVLELQARALAEHVARVN